MERRKRYSRKFQRLAEIERSLSAKTATKLLQQIVDSFIAGLLMEEAFEWLAERQELADQIAPECTDPTDGGH
jgi:hypothetical protein